MIVQWRSVDSIPCTRSNEISQLTTIYNSSLTSLTNSSDVTCPYSKCYSNGDEVLAAYSINKVFGLISKNNFLADD